MIYLNYKSTLSTHSLSSRDVYESTCYNSLADKEPRCAAHRRLTSIQEKSGLGRGVGGGRYMRRILGVKEICV